MVRNFKGQVRIEDVQKEFDNLTTDINKTIDEYNSADKVKEIDYTSGGPNLGNSGYCLTVGGLKQFLNLFDKHVIGCKPYKQSDSSIRVSDGLYITKDNIKKIKGTTIIKKNAGSLWYNVDKNELNCPDGTYTTQETIKLPEFTASNTWGNISSTYDSGNAWRCRKNHTGWANDGFQVSNRAYLKSCNMPNSQDDGWTGKAPNKFTILWSFPETITIPANSSISIGISLHSEAAWTTWFLSNYRVRFNGGRLSVFNQLWNDDMYKETRHMVVKTTNQITTNFIAFDIYIAFLQPNLEPADVNPKFQNLTINNGSITTTTTHIGSGEGVGIKICDLNWNRGSSLAIDTLNNVKFSDQ